MDHPPSCAASIAGPGGNSPKGTGKETGPRPSGQGSPVGHARLGREAQRTRRVRKQGALLFGYFLLGKQEKVPRPSIREWTKYSAWRSHILC